MTNMLFLPDDSPLRNPPASTEPKQLVAFDGLRYILDMLSIAYSRLLDDLHRLSVDFPNIGPDKQVVASAFLNSWSIVDNLYRLYQLLHDIPRLKRTPPLEVYLRAISKVEDLRHGVQHLDERLSEYAAASTPVWGTLRWFYTPGAPEDGGTAMTLVSGAVRSGYRQAINPLGKSYFIPIGLVTLDAFEKSIDLSDLMDRTRKMILDFDQSLRKAVGSAPTGGADLLIGIEMEFGKPSPQPNKAG